MPSFSILHLADLHLDSPLRGLEADPDAPTALIRGATRAAFTTAVDFAIGHGVALVLIAGDLFDGDWQDWRTGQFLTTQLSRLSAASIPVVAIRGNHDAESVITRALPALDLVDMLRSDMPATKRFEDLGVAVHGQSFATRDVFDNLAQAYPPPVPGLLNIGLLHTGATGRDGHAKYAPCTPEQLASHGYDYWALGHIHAREVLGADPWIVFAGNIQGRHIRETGAKGGTLITVRDGRIATVEPVDFDVLRWRLLDVKLDGVDEPEAAFQAVRVAIRAAIAEAQGRFLALRIVLTGATAAHKALSLDASETRERVRTELLAAGGDGTAWLESITIRTGPALDMEALRARPDATGALVRAIETLDGEFLGAEVRDYASALLDRASGLRDALGPYHPVVRLAAGEMPEEMLAQARALLLGRLAEG